MANDKQKGKRTEEAEETPLSLDDLNTIEVGQGIEVSEYEGQKVEIEDAQVILVKQPYDPETGEFHEGGQFSVQKLRVRTKPVASLKGPDGEIHIRGSELFNLKLKDGKYGVSTSERSSLAKLLKKLKLPVSADGVRQLPGKQVVLKVVTNNQGQDWLGFVY